MREIQNSPIGVFDSGVGGLTVLRELYQQLPQESILYFADTARLPYGNRSAKEILQFVREILAWMAQQKVKMVIMACNTSSALALEAVRQEFDFPILGVILPGAKAAVERGKRIGVISTPATAKSQAYRRAIQEIDPTAQVWQLGCPRFVPLIEQNRLWDVHTQEVAREYLVPLLAHDIDTLVYGCTHYRHLEAIIKTIIPSSVKLVDPATYVVQAAKKELELMGLSKTSLASPTRFAVSGSSAAFSHLSQQWLGYCPSVESVSLPIGFVSTFPREQVEVLE
ncbi:glutamate racemase [Crocosphaera sp. Alani8]|uniref:glutamate racemase n=1 Tax=Crocosphaera sp. Alani8 TaxID=3038952 RepID=UPI00313EE328